MILIAGDNPDNMLVACDLLKDVCPLIEAWDGQAVVDQARLHKPDLILIDISPSVLVGSRL